MWHACGILFDCKAVDDKRIHSSILDALKDVDDVEVLKTLLPVNDEEMQEIEDEEQFRRFLDRNAGHSINDGDALPSCLNLSSHIDHNEQTNDEQSVRVGTQTDTEIQETDGGYDGAG